MDSQPVDRRQFHRSTLDALTAAAFGGLLAGTTGGCGSEAGKETAAVAGPHACRGLNECKGQGADGKNACAGQGTCANVKPHSCGGMNDCKNLGGCGKEAGANSCKGQGGCEVPMTHAWATARKNFEKRMQDAGKKFGDAPTAAEKKG